MLPCVLTTLHFLIKNIILFNHKLLAIFGNETKLKLLLANSFNEYRVKLNNYAVNNYHAEYLLSIVLQ